MSLRSYANPLKLGLRISSYCFRYCATYDGKDMIEARPNMADRDKEHIWIYQDEAVYHSNDFQNASYWLKLGEQVLKQKGQEQLIMVSSFICK